MHPGNANLGDIMHRLLSVFVGAFLGVAAGANALELKLDPTRPETALGARPAAIATPAATEASPSAPAQTDEPRSAGSPTPITARPRAAELVGDGKGSSIGVFGSVESKDEQAKRNAPLQTPTIAGQDPLGRYRGDLPNVDYQLGVRITVPLR